MKNIRDITQERYLDGAPRIRRFHQARWDEPLLFELSQTGQRGLLVPEVEEGIRSTVGDVLQSIPKGLRRSAPPQLPELSQPQIVRHFTRLSQETLGPDVNIAIGMGTCTMKYNPKINEQFVRNPKFSALHPLQDEATVQGILHILHSLERMLCEISGMHRISLQPGGGSVGIYANASIVRAYHEARGEGRQRTEAITTIFSHPSNAACPATAGYNVITLYPDKDGYPDLDALRAAVSRRTAALFITNPEDTGIFNPRILEFVRLVHDAGGLCVYDQANANGILGITRAGDAGFDLCHFNLHKTFSTPHSSGGPGSAAIGASRDLAPFLPRPTVEFDGKRYFLDNDRPHSIGKVAPFYGVVANALRAYAWIRSLGAAGLQEVAEIAVLNNNYLMKKILDIPGFKAPYAQGKRRIEQVRYSTAQLAEETGIHAQDLGRRAADYGIHYWFSHHPWIVPDPVTLEPSESYSQAELDEFASILAQLAGEARTDPERLRTAPHHSSIHAIHHDPLDDPDQWAMTWRGYRRKVRGSE
jgi:glycine dehydrogenase subunit 2